MGNDFNCSKKGIGRFRKVKEDSVRNSVVDIFKEITNAKEEFARAYLVENGWDLEVSLKKYLTRKKDEDLENTVNELNNEVNSLSIKNDEKNSKNEKEKKIEKFNRIFEISTKEQAEKYLEANEWSLSNASKHFVTDSVAKLTNTLLSETFEDEEFKIDEIEIEKEFEENCKNEEKKE